MTNLLFFSCYPPLHTVAPRTVWSYPFSVVQKHFSCLAKYLYLCTAIVDCGISCSLHVISTLNDFYLQGPAPFAGGQEGITCNP